MPTAPRREPADPVVYPRTVATSSTDGRSPTMTSASDLEPEVRDDPGAAPLTDEEGTYEVVIEPRAGWRLVDWHELYEYRDLFRFLIWRQIKVQYAQSALGIGWAVIQPLFAMTVFTVVFGRLANVGSDGVPYAVFSLAALVPWTYFSNALTEGTNSLVGNTAMLGKVYFPRMLLPLAAVCGKLVDFGIALAMLGAAMVYYETAPTSDLIWFPMLVALMIVSAGGMGMWLTALAIQYRDIKFAMTFVVQILMYLTPVVYPASLIPATWVWGGVTFHPRLYYAVNPMVGVIEGFRSALLGTNPMPWDLIAVGVVSAGLIAVSGVFYFRRKERLFADVA
jgi:lipopolysaccharide transport system permease protein